MAYTGQAMLSNTELRRVVVECHSQKVIKVAHIAKTFERVYFVVRACFKHRNDDGGQITVDFMSAVTWLKFAKLPSATACMGVPATRPCEESIT